MKTMIIHASCFNEDEMLQGDHACITSHMQIQTRIQHNHALIILANNLPSIRHIKCSRCLPWAFNGAGYFKNLQEIISPPFSYFSKRFKSPHNIKSVLKSVSNIFEKNTKINLVKMKNTRKRINSFRVHMFYLLNFPSWKRNDLNGLFKDPVETKVKKNVHLI